MRLFRLAVLSLALAGLAVSLAWHLVALLGHVTLGAVYPALLLACAAVYVGALTNLQGLGPVLRHAGNWQFLRFALYGAPRWTVWFGYLAPFYVIGTLYFNGGRLGVGLDMSQVAGQRVVSAFLVVLYGLSTAFTYAALRRKDLRVHWRCANGHECAQPQRECSQCGADVRPTLDIETLAPN